MPPVVAHGKDQPSCDTTLTSRSELGYRGAIAQLPLPRSAFCCDVGLPIRSTRSRENPSYHSCWLNESDNKTMARIAASCHRRVFEIRVINSWVVSQSGGWFKKF